MASMIPAAGSAALGNAGIRNQGGQAGFLGGPGAIDGSAQSFWNLADPANLTGNASSGHILSNILDPGNVFGQNQAANPLGPNGANGANGVPSVLPNLGAASLIPQMPQGAFQHFSGQGPYNQMAAQSMGGQMFNPSAPSPGKGANVPNQGMHAIGGKGAANGGFAGGATNPIVNNNVGHFAVPMMMRNNADKVRH